MYSVGEMSTFFLIGRGRPEIIFGDSRPFVLSNLESELIATNCAKTFLGDRLCSKVSKKKEVYLLRS